MSDKPNDGGPAFPGNVHHSHEVIQPFFGMTVRDYFAAKAMQGFCADPEFSSLNLAEAAYRVADNMLKARNV